MVDKINIILTGSTGMVGEGVLTQCLSHPAINKVLVISRRACGIFHPRLQELIIEDFADLAGKKEQLTGFSACFFCLGVTSIGVKEPEYFKTTYTLTLDFASLLAGLNKEMVFSYISGASTDSTEKGKMMWARVKGKTENDLMKLHFKRVYCFRPGFLKPDHDALHVLPAYKYLGWLFPLFSRLAPQYACTLAELGRAMINTTLYGYQKSILEVTDIHIQAKIPFIPEPRKS